MTYNEIVDRSLEILKANTPLAKKVNLRFGELQDDNAKLSPEVQVILAKPYAIENRIGTSYARDYPYTTQVIIKVISATTTVEKTTREINDIIDMVQEIIRNNPTFTKPTDSSDPKFVRSRIQSADVTQNTRGKTKQVATITIEALVISFSKMNIPDIGEISIIEETPSGYGWETQDIPDDDGTVDVVPHTLVGTKYYKIEIDHTLEQSLEALIESAKPVTISITQGSNVRSLKMFVKNISPAITINGMSTAVLEMRRTN